MSLSIVSALDHDREVRKTAAALVGQRIPQTLIALLRVTDGDGRDRYEHGPLPGFEGIASDHRQRFTKLSHHASLPSLPNYRSTCIFCPLSLASDLAQAGLFTVLFLPAAVEFDHAYISYANGGYHPKVELLLVEGTQQHVAVHTLEMNDNRRVVPFHYYAAHRAKALRALRKTTLSLNQVDALKAVVAWDPSATVVLEAAELLLTSETR